MICEPVFEDVQLGDLVLYQNTAHGHFTVWEITHPRVPTRAVTFYGGMSLALGVEVDTDLSSVTPNIVALPVRMAQAGYTLDASYSAWRPHAADRAIVERNGFTPSRPISEYDRRYLTQKLTKPEPAGRSWYERLLKLWGDR